MSSHETRIVHESEAQRQYVRLQLPVELEIGGKRYLGEDWSSGGVALKWPVEELRSDHTPIRMEKHFHAVVLFKFDVFQINLPVELEARNVSAEKGRVGCRFVNLTAGQISLLQFIVNAYITGEIVRMGDIIGVVARNNFTDKRALPSATEGLTSGQLFKRKLSKMFNWALVFGASGGLLLYIVLGLWERNFIVTADTATVMAESLLVESPKAGKLYYQPIKPGTRVNKGAPLLMVETSKGNMESVDSPCDCVVRERLSDNHAQVGTGDAVLRLMSTESAPYVQAELPYKQALRLNAGDEAMLGLSGFDHLVAGKILSIETGHDIRHQATLYIESAEKLPVELIGGPAEVRVNTFGQR